MIYKLTIQGRLQSLNEYSNAERTNRFMAAKMKKDAEEMIIWECKRQLKEVKIDNKITLHITWIEPNMKRDLDNIRFGVKFIQDALVNAGIIANDGWKNIQGYTDKFKVDKDNPRIDIEILEVE